MRGTVASLSRGQVDAAVSEIDGLVDAEMERTGVPGVAVAVVYDDEVVFAEGYGVRKVETHGPGLDPRPCSSWRRSPSR